MKNKHMTLDDRIEIQECLAKGISFKDIGKRIGKSATTISREIKLHLQVHSNGYTRSDEVCPLLLKAPFVCNGCDKKSRANCPYKRQIYVAKYAQQAYEDLLVESRSGIALNKESFYETEKIISNAVRNGQHIYHAIISNNVNASVSSVYRYIKAGYYSIGLLDLPRAVKFKARNEKKSEFVPQWAKQGRTYADFLEFVSQNADISITQLDTVIGEIGGKVIMTIHFVCADFMVGLLLDNKSAAEAASKFAELKQRLEESGYKFGEIAPVLLTDNGGEFSIVSAFENNADGNPESHMFFCEPCSPHEKAHIEKNHTLFRDIVPAGTSFNKFTQETVNLIFSHVNSVKRKQFNGKSAYEMFSFSFSEQLANALGIYKIEATEVVQSASLLKQSFSK